MLDNITVKKIEDFVYGKPRSVQEIAQHLGKNWRTADRYIDEIEKQFGTITTRVFRQGTRGALKIVYWSSVDKVSHSVFQEKLEKEILNAKGKEDFSAFDIFQYVNPEHKQVEVRNTEDENLAEFKTILLKAKKQVLFFSGNLSFINIHNKKLSLFDFIEELIKKGVSIKVLTRVDIAGFENVEKLLSLNFKYGKEVVSIKHAEHPIRAVVIDNSVLRMKEVKEPTGKMHELNKKIFIYYTINDKEWVDWMTKIFWKISSYSIDANKRLEEIKRIKR